MTTAALNTPLRIALYNIFTMLSLPAADFALYRTRMERALNS
jgi:hypothetical protein